MTKGTSMPEWDGEVFERWGKELERNMLRSRNGLRMLGGERFVRTGASAKDVVWRARKAELWHYRPLVEKRYRTPLLIYIGLISRSYVLDLHPQNSLVERLLLAGFDVFVLDWGEPDEADADNDVATYTLDLLPRAIKALLRTTGSEDLNIMSYCMGGTLTLTMLGAGVEVPVRSLVTMATPIDFSHMGEYYGPLISGKMSLDRAIDASGNVPPNLIHSVVRIRRPTGDLVQYANLWENLWNEDFLEGFQSMREWVADHIPFPGAAFRDLVKLWLQDNCFVNGTAKVAGRRIDLSRITCPVLCLLAEYDEMIPYPAAEPLPKMLTGADVTVASLKSGHISLVCGRSAERKTMPVLLDWLGRHSEPVPDRTEAAA